MRMMLSRMSVGVGDALNAVVKVWLRLERIVL